MLASCNEIGGNGQPTLLPRLHMIDLSCPCDLAVLAGAGIPPHDRRRKTRRRFTRDRCQQRIVIQSRPHLSVAARCLRSLDKLVAAAIDIEGDLIS
jgi:ribosomal protein L28